MPRRRTHDRTVMVLYSTYGGPARTVGEALAVGLKSRPGVEVESIDLFERCMPAMGVLARFAYGQTSDFFFGVTGALRDAEALPTAGSLVAELRLRGIAALQQVIASSDPAVVLATCPVAAGAAAEAAAGSGVPCVSVVSDLGARHVWRHPGIGLYFVPTREARDELVVTGVPYDRVVVTGIPVRDRIAADAGRSECRASLGLADRFTVAVAGSGVLGDEGDAVSALVRSAFQVAALVGENQRARDRARKAVSASPEQVVAIEELHRYGVALGAADLMVCAPGSPRIPEALSVGLPLILYNPVPEREIENADFLVNSGAALLARDEMDVAEKCRFLAAHPERLGQIAAASAALGRPRATQVVIDRVLAVV